jgi:hypothetical protein
MKILYVQFTPSSEAQAHHGVKDVEFPDGWVLIHYLDGDSQAYNSEYVYTLWTESE